MDYKIDRVDIWLEPAIELYLKNYRYWDELRNNTALIDSSWKVIFFIINRDNNKNYYFLQVDIEYKWKKTKEIKYDLDNKKFDIIKEIDTIKKESLLYN